MDALRSCHPRFEKAWSDAVAQSTPAQPPAMELLASYALVTVDLVRVSDPALPTVFGLIERLLAEGDPEVVEHVTTDYIEVLSNLWPSDLDPSWQGWLGPRASALAQEWAAFWGAPK